MIDIHSHLIPGVDDGSESMDSTLSLVGRACRQGAVAFFATPHSYAFENQAEEVRRRFAAMQRQLALEYPDIAVYLGCEVHCCREKMAEICENLASGAFPTMNGSAYVLAEFARDADWDTIVSCLSALQNRGWIPVIAHVERCSALVDRMDLIHRLRALGCRIQLNVYSLESIQPPQSRDWARRLILEEAVDYLGTDMHGFWTRLPSITQGMLWLEEHCTPTYLEAITRRNAEEAFINI